MFMGIKYLPSYETNDLALTMEVSDDVEEIPKDKPLARLVGCFWCLTTWISILFCVIYEILYSREIFETFAGIFICTGISGFLNEKLH